MSKHAIEVKNVKKSFFLPHHKNNSLKTAITQVFKSRERGGETFNALNGISFTVEKGDFFGILGRNGSGKSTLLKIISEIYQPTSGTVKHDGKLVSFIELGVGFKPELSGRENVFLNGALLGFSKEEIAEMYEDIVAFAELEAFMDQKLKNYSSGMKVRLAFSVAIRAKADILILDEVLAVGDAAFQEKCTDYFETLKNDGKTVILVTHSMSNVRKFCNRAILIEGGKITCDGAAEEVADAYLGLFDSEKSVNDEQVAHSGSDKVEFVTADAKVDANYIELSFTIENKTNKAMSDIHVFADIRRNTQLVTGFLTTEIGDGLSLAPRKTKTLTLRTENIFGNGDFSVTASLRDGRNNHKVLDKWAGIVEFSNGFARDNYYPVEVRFEEV